jgi:CRISPR-associated endonuclease/helicase Cas3
MTFLAKSAGASGQAETLMAHTLAVTQMALALCHRLPFPAESLDVLGTELELAAALHDIGKASPGFQRVLRGERPDWNGWRHEALSAGFACALEPSVSEEVIFAVLCHHREIPGQFSNRTLRFFGGEPEGWPRMIDEWRQVEELVRAFWATLGIELKRPEWPNASKVARITLSRGWLDDSPTNGQLKQIPPAKRHRASLLRGLLISADHLASAHQELPAPVVLRSFQMAHHPRPFQAKAGATAGHAILRAPTGSGKTEAAVLWAAMNQNQNARFFYVLPYTAAINAMHRRLQNGFPQTPDSVGILHGRAAHHLYSRMLDDCQGDRRRAQREARARARLAREMYHPVRVCTPHQLLRYTLHGGGWEQMLAEASNACIVFDEIHSYQPDISGLILGTARLFAEQFGARVLFASATLPQFLQKRIQELIPCAVIEPDPDLSADREVLDRKRHSVRVVNGNILGAAKSILADAQEGRAVLVVCNHVRTAQLLFRTLAATPERIEAVLFHSRFNMEDRRRIEISLQRSLPRILIATQVVEVSLDIDFDCGYVEPAPIDALTQRMGRVNRCGSRPPAAVSIFRQSLGTFPIYGDTLTERTIEELGKAQNPISEQDLVQICDRVYGDGYSAEQECAFKERLNHPYFTEFLQRMLAGRSEPWVEKVLGDSADGRADAVPRFLLARYQDLMKQGLWLDADALLVNIRVAAFHSRIDWTQEPPVVDAPYTSEEGLL